MTHQSIQSTVALVSSERSNQDEVAAAAFLARYGGRTLDAYRQDLRGYFAWEGSMGLDVLSATRPHVELYRHHLELGAWLPPPSTDACRQSVASTASLTLTAGSPRTLPSTSAVRTSIRPRDADSTVRKWDASCSPRSASTTTMPRWLCSSG
jgi:hypothetical protein